MWYKWYIVKKSITQHQGRYIRQLKETQLNGSGVKPKNNYYLNEYLNFHEPFTISGIKRGNLTINQEPIDDKDDKSENEEQQFNEDEDDIDCSEMSSAIFIVNIKIPKRKGTILNMQKKKTTGGWFCFRRAKKSFCCVL